MTTIAKTPELATITTLGDEERLRAAKAKTSISNPARLAINAAVQKQISEEIATSAENNYETDRALSENMPVIRQPTTNLTSKGNVLKLMAEYQSLTNDLDSYKLQNKLASFNAGRQAQSNKLEKLSDEYIELQEEVDNLQAEITENSKSLDSAEASLNGSKAQLDAAQKKLDSLLKKLGVDSADDPAVADNKDVQEAVAQLKSAQLKFDSANKLYQSVKARHEQLINKITVATNNYLDKVSEVEIITSEVINDNSFPAHGNIKEALTRTAIMIQLITEFINKIDEASNEKLKKDLEINRKQLEARQAEMKRKSDEYEEKVRKAEELQKTLGCLGKVFGGLMIAIGALTTVFGGAGVAAMAVGISLMAVDIISEQLMGESLIGKAMGWIMEEIISPIAKIVSKIVDKLFDVAGINKLLEVIGKEIGYDLLGLMKTVSSAVTTIATFLALALIAKSLIKTLMKKFVSKIVNSIVKAITATINKIISKISSSIVKAAAKGKRALTIFVRRMITSLKSAASKINNSIFKNSSSKDPEMIKNLREVIGKRLEQVNVAVGLTNTVVSSSLNIIIADTRLQANKNMAEFRLAQTDYEILKDLLSTILKKFQNDQDDINSITKVLNASLESSANASKFVAHNIRA